MIWMGTGMPRPGDLVLFRTHGIWQVSRFEENGATQSKWVQDGLMHYTAEDGIDGWYLEEKGVYLGETPCKNDNASRYGPVHWFYSFKYGPCYVQQGDLQRIEIIRRLEDPDGK